MFYDLCAPWKSNLAENQRTLAFLSELGYNVVAVDHTLTGKIPTDLTCAIPDPLPIPSSPGFRTLRRCTLVLTDPSQNHRLASLASTYDILALRPTNERALVQACQSLECDLISLDLSARFPFYFKHKTCSIALQRGIRFEICYAAGVLANDGGASRRNLISNATQLIRATRGRGIVISSQAENALACRGPSDVVNLAVLWGLSQERGVEAIGREARAVVLQAEMKRRSFRGVIDVIYGGEKPKSAAENAGNPSKGKPENSNKRKAEILDTGTGPDDTVQGKPLSKREQKRQAKKARLDAVKVGDNNARIVLETAGGRDPTSTTITPPENNI